MADPRTHIPAGMREAALAYAARGWPVFAVSPASGAPLADFGPDRASIQPEAIAHHWSKRPGDMIGVVLGRRAVGGCGAAVAAVRLAGEIVEGGSGQLRFALGALGDALPAAMPMSLTPEGEVLLWFEASDELGDGELDWAVVPPSARTGAQAARAGLDGRAHAWVDGIGPFERPPPAMTAEIAEKLRASREGAQISKTESAASKGQDKGRGRGGGGDGGGDELARALFAEPLNDTGNARRLLKRHGADFVMVRHVGMHWWTGSHWEPEGGDERVQAWAQATAEAIHDEAELCDVPKAAEARRGFARQSGNSGRIAGMVNQARPHRTLASEALDAEALAINVGNGTLRLKSEVVGDPDDDGGPDPEGRADPVRAVRWRAELDGHRREDWCAKAMDVDWDDAAECPKWRAFLERVQPQPAMRAFLQRFHGYALTGLTSAQIFVYHWGGGGNGKTTFLETLMRLMGDYAQPLPAESITGDMQRRGDSATPDMARLPGARLVRCAEIPRGQKLRENLVKELTGGERMLVRHLHERFFSFKPVFKIIGYGNDKPSVGGVDDGIWRRVKLVPWTQVIPEGEARDMETVIAEFLAERAGILRWLVDGLLDYLEGGLQVPAEIADATLAYRAEQDPVGEFLDAIVERPVPGAIVTAREMYEAYVAWCHASSVRPFAERGFARIMSTKGIEKKLGRVRQYLNVRLSDDRPIDPERADGRQNQMYEARDD